MKVCHIITALVFGGAERLLVNHTNLQSGDHEIHIIYLKGEPQIKPLLHPDIKVHYIPLNFKVLANVKKFLKELKPDIVHTHVGHADLIGLWASRKLSAKVFCTMHNVAYKGNWLDNIIYFLYRFSFNRISKKAKITCVSEAIYDHVTKRLKVNPKRVIFIPNSINEVSIAESNSDIRAKNGIPVDAFCLLTVSRLTPNKSIETLIEALPQLKKEIENLYVVIIGSGEHLEFLKNLAVELDVQDVVNFKGGVLNPEYYYKVTDLFIHPSLFEGLPTVILEAFRGEAAVVASDIPGNNDLVKEGETGLLFPKQDSSKLATQIIKLYKNATLCKKLAQNGHQLFLNKYSIKKYASSIEKFYGEE
ncbi:MAG TPA: hypothetical protein DCS93_08975 [Microscillaceae bacterium]|nr:hypothetical protein [Microscillaceae bacterium]